MNKLQTFIDAYGSGKLAADLDVSKSAVSSWRNGRFRMSHTMARKVAACSGGALTVYDLRPDIFGPAPGSPQHIPQDQAA